MIRKINITILLLLTSLSVMIIFFVLNINTLPPQIPLFYSAPPGDEQMIDTGWIILIPILMVLAVGINMFLSKKVFPQQFLIERIIFYTNNSIIIFSCFMFLRIIFLVS